MNHQETCKKHGAVPVWIVCKHISNGSSDTIIFSENQDALCFACADNFKNLSEEDVTGMCEGCLKDFTAQLMINSQSFANLKNRVVGVEHLKGKWSPKDNE